MSAQQELIDSLRGILPTQKEDTVKVNALNLLSKKLNSIGTYDSALLQVTEVD